MLELFTFLSHMLTDSWWIALLSSFIWGILSIILSPCHLTTIPLIIGFINNSENITKIRAALLSTLFALGILITLGLIGLLTGISGRILGDIGGFGNYIVGAFLIIFGVYMMDIIKIPFFEQGISPHIKKRGLLSAFLIGLTFGIALGPCAFAFMAPMLGIVFKIASSNLIYSLLLILLFSLGHCFVIVFAGTFTEIIRKYLKWNEKSNGVIWLKRICGILIICSAIYLFFTA